MITAIRVASVVLAVLITRAAWQGSRAGTIAGPVTVVAYAVAATILAACWALGHIHRRYS